MLATVAYEGSTFGIRLQAWSQFAFNAIARGKSSVYAAGWIVWQDGGEPTTAYITAAPGVVRFGSMVTTGIVTTLRFDGAHWEVTESGKREAPGSPWQVYLTAQ